MTAVDGSGTSPDDPELMILMMIESELPLEPQETV
jgi:hypothetical protein